MLIPFGVLSAAAFAPSGDYELIETAIVSGSSTTSITFSNLGDYASTYKHLQLRIASRTDRATDLDFIRLRFNSDSGSNYRFHRLLGSGSSVISDDSGSSTGVHLFRAGGNTNPTNSFGVVVSDILDAYSSTKNTTVRSLGGATGTTSDISLCSGLWNDTSSITSIFCGVGGGTNFIAGSRFSLYGIRG
jgi:hypothetical protein